MMPCGRSKHLTKKESKALQAEIVDVYGEPNATMKGVRMIINALID
jgi:hypothetical protein